MRSSKKSAKGEHANRADAGGIHVAEWNQKKSRKCLDGVGAFSKSAGKMQKDTLTKAGVDNHETVPGSNTVQKLGSASSRNDTCNPKRSAFAKSVAKENVEDGSITGIAWGWGKGSPIFFLMEAVRAASAGHGFCTLSCSDPKLATDYLETITKYLHKKRINTPAGAISAKLQQLASQYGPSEASFESCEAAVMRSHAATRHDRIWTDAKGNSRDADDALPSAGPGSIPRLSLDLAPSNPTLASSSPAAEADAATVVSTATAARAAAAKAQSGEELRAGESAADGAGAATAEKARRKRRGADSAIAEQAAAAAALSAADDANATKRLRAGPTAPAAAAATPAAVPAESDSGSASAAAAAASPRKRGRSRSVFASAGPDTAPADDAAAAAADAPAADAVEPTLPAAAGPRRPGRPRLGAGGGAAAATAAAASSAALSAAAIAAVAGPGPSAWSRAALAARPAAPREDTLFDAARRAVARAGGAAAYAAADPAGVRGRVRAAFVQAQTRAMRTKLS
jgi:hypothetical protein